MSSPDTNFLLLAEDEVLIATVMTAELEDGGFEVVCVTSGDAAMKALEANFNRILCVVTDIRMPGGIDGWEVARYARHLVPSMPVVYMSGDQAHQWAELGVPGSIMLTKPFANAQMITAVSQLVNALPPVPET